MENTQKLRTIILEDDLVAKVLLEHFCENHPYLTFINTFDNVDDAAAYLETNGTDLIFLDIMLKDSVGFDLLNKQTDNKTKIVVTTSNPAFFNLFSAIKNYSENHHQIFFVYRTDWFLLCSKLLTRHQSVIPG